MAGADYYKHSQVTPPPHTHTLPQPSAGHTNTEENAGKDTGSQPGKWVTQHGDKQFGLGGMEETP